VWDNIDPDADEVEYANIDGSNENLSPLSLTLQPIKAMQNPIRENRFDPTTVPIGNLPMLQKLLITHFDVSFKLGLISWPRRMCLEVQKRLKKTEIISEFSAVRRALAFKNDMLYVSPSNLRVEGDVKGIYDKTVGDGLFTRMPINKGDIIAEFLNEWITRTDYEERTEAGKGGYIIKIKEKDKIDRYMDCYNFQHICKASKANSVVRAIDLSSYRKAIENSSMFVRKDSSRVFLKAKSYIPCNGEIMYHYADEYQYPDVLLYTPSSQSMLDTTIESDSSDEDYTNS